MKSGLYFIALSVFLFTAGCKKDEKKTTIDLTTVRVRTVTHSTGFSESYSYDGEGRITQEQSSTGSKTTYAYSGDTLTITSFDTLGNLAGTELMLLSNGLAQSSVLMEASGTVIGFNQYTFDIYGQETSHTTFNTNMEQTQKEEWVWNDGKYEQYRIYDTTLTPLYTLYYWYNYPTAGSIGNQNFGKKHLGVDAKYQLRKILQTGMFGNTYRTIEYTSDDQQRILTASYYDQNHILVNTDSYTYY